VLYDAEHLAPSVVHDLQRRYGVHRCIHGAFVAAYAALERLTGLCLSLAAGAIAVFLPLQLSLYTVNFGSRGRRKSVFVRPQWRQAWPSSRGVNALSEGRPIAVGVAGIEILPLLPSGEAVSVVRSAFHPAGEGRSASQQLDAEVCAPPPLL